MMWRRSSRKYHSWFRVSTIYHEANARSLSLMYPFDPKPFNGSTHIHAGPQLRANSSLKGRPLLLTRMKSDDWDGIYGSTKKLALGTHRSFLPVRTCIGVLRELESDDSMGLSLFVRRESLLPVTCLDKWSFFVMIAAEWRTLSVCHCHGIMEGFVGVDAQTAEEKA